MARRQLFLLGFVIPVGGGSLIYNSLSQDPLDKAPPEVRGSWTSGCRPKEGAHVGPYNSAVEIKKGGAFKSYNTLYESDDCDDPLMKHRYRGKIVFIPNDDLGPNGFDIVYKIREIRITPLTKDVAENANEKSLHGKRSWYKGGSKTFRTMTLSYDIMKFENGKIYFGDSGTGNQKTAVERPTKFQSFAHTRVDPEEIEETFAH